MPLNETYTCVASAEFKTSSKLFKYRWELRAVDKTAASSDYYIYTYLMWIDGSGGTPAYVKKGSCPVINPNSHASESCVNKNPTTYLTDRETLARMQHRWTITYVIDGVSSTYTANLPDDNAKPGVNHTGHLHMLKNEWYQWGPPKKINWKNDGSSHIIKVTMQDVQGFNYPKSCPDSSSNPELVYTTQPHAIIPDKPKLEIKGTWYNYGLAWNMPTGATQTRLKRWVVGPSRSDTEWEEVVAYGTTTRYAPDHFEFEPGTVVYYQVEAKSSTGHTSISANDSNKPADTDYQAPTVGGGVKIKVNGAWKSGTVYVKVNGEWVKADYVMIKQNNSWKVSDF